jgi:hypothetical protein
MRKILAVFLFFALPLAAQVNNPSVRYVVTSPSGSCSEAPPIQVNSTNGNVCTCGGGTWTCSGGVVYPGVTSPGTGGLQGTDWELGTTGTSTCLFLDETGLSTTAMPVYYSSDCQGNFFSPTVGQIELVSYHIDPDLP